MCQQLLMNLVLLLNLFNSVSHVYSIRCTVNYILLQEGGKRCVNKVVMEQKIQYEDSIGRKI